MLVVLLPLVELALQATVQSVALLPEIPPAGFLHLVVQVAFQLFAINIHTPRAHPRHVELVQQVLRPVVGLRHLGRFA